ncbi:hypothetical protein K439DRAFT_179906 [Ramaria rubella]|nr:hypothetical protein K439DRAFT_179906 [Ramaria rubella]
MSIPQNNLDDLKRRTHPGLWTSQTAQSQDGGQPKNFKFKSATGNIRSPASSSSCTVSSCRQVDARLDSSTLATYSKCTSVSNADQRKPLSPQMKPPLSQAKPHHLNSKSSVSFDGASVKTSSSITPSKIEHLPALPSPSGLPLKRSSSDDNILSSNGSYKRPRTAVHSTMQDKGQEVLNAEWRTVEAGLETKIIGLSRQHSPPSSSLDSKDDVD